MLIYLYFLCNFYIISIISIIHIIYIYFNSYLFLTIKYLLSTKMTLSMSMTLSIIFLNNIKLSCTMKNFYKNIVSVLEIKLKINMVFYKADENF